MEPDDDLLDRFLAANPAARAAHEARLERAAAQAAEAATKRAEAVTALALEVASIAGNAAQANAATNKSAADANFPWYVPYLKLRCREQHMVACNMRLC